MDDYTSYILPEEEARRPLTARNLEDFALCPRKYLLSFFETREHLRRFLGGPAALGQALRRALIEFHQRGGVEAVTEAELGALFEADWDPALCADSLEAELLHRDGRRMLTAYHEGQQRDPAPVVRVDMRMEEEIGGERFVAVADRVDELPEGPLRLVRFTSSHRPPSPAALAEDTSALLLLAVGRRQFPERCVEVAVHALRPGRLIMLVTTDEEAARFESSLLRRARTVRSETAFAPRKGAQCKWCRSIWQCPAWPRRSS
jgi:hypothetical protein